MFRFPKKAHVYNLVNGRYLGNVDHVELPFGKGIPYAFELLPEKADVASFEASGPKLELKLSSSVDGAAQIRVYRPDGTEARAYRANVLVRGGRASHVIPFAVSDPRGTWKATAESVFGGRREVAVEKR